MESSFRNQLWKSPQAVKAPKKEPKPLQNGHPNGLKKSCLSTLTEVGLTRYLLYLELIGRSRNDPTKRSESEERWEAVMEATFSDI